MCACACLSLAVSPGFSLSELTRLHMTAQNSRDFTVQLLMNILSFFSTSTCSVFLFFLATRENNIKMTLKHFVLFKNDGHDFHLSPPRVFVLICTLLLFGETCQLSEPSLVHLTFKLPLHFFSLYYLSCANTHFISPFLLSFVKWNRRVFRTNCHLHLIHSAHCYIKGSGYVLLFCLKLSVIMFFLFILLFPCLLQSDVEKTSWH